MSEFLLNSGLTILDQHISWAELVGQLSALLVVLLADRRTIWTWPVQILATVMLFIVYMSATLGGLAARQVAILLISVYGWWAWTRHKRTVFGMVVRTATARERLLIGVAMVVGTGAFGGLLTYLNAQGFHASWNPFPDAWIFVGTLVAFGAQAVGLVEFWLVWLAVDIVGVPLQIKSGLYFSALVYVVFAALVVKGFLDWRKTALRSVQAAAAAAD
ncbi:nicotinamide mononucleotide transporter family protein [Phytomonospora endophytica]|uniref:Nicotinamide mononucleotide transporter n=1 Tax=Phytomonospora endophytica TaxID=714109 RepID=A0A841FNE4_9ACTN|nr:nicotinamide mononucleotide transporter family protein [Phytomonospora endophytica]MBB6037364.1 nicotinamide mononucleotide transporter [Phytomonospora endophytica]